MSQPARNGINLIGVFVILAIIGVVVAMLIPAVRRVRYSAARMQCSNNLRQLILGVHLYGDWDSRQAAESPVGPSKVPPTVLFPAGCVGPAGPPEERLSWMVAILPYLEQAWLHRRFDMKAGYAGNLSAAQTGLTLFRCPDANLPVGDASTHYVAMAGIGTDAASRPAGADGNGFMGYDRQTSSTSIRDGLANTIALVETSSGVGPWARGGTSTLRGFDPADTPWCGERHVYGGLHTGGAQVAMADGSVRMIFSRIDSKKLAAAITIAGGEKVDLE